jgi:hypothetical protein
MHMEQTCMNVMDRSRACSPSLHWLTGGVWTLHWPGSASARVALTVTPSDAAAPPPSTAHRHRGEPRTTLASAEQHAELGGADEVPVVNERHGNKLTMDAVQPADDDGVCAAHRGAPTASAAAVTASRATADDSPRAIVSAPTNRTCVKLS